jgi:ArsR family transcriptional regulator, lead/cadmium/zinc/bismuth-responsive transcriptional repressor
MVPRSQPVDGEPGGEWCEENVIHAAAVRRARAALPAPSVSGQLADLFGTLADPTRVRLIAALAEGELCVCDLAATLGLSQSAVSHQLRLLRHLSLVRTRRVGRVIYYALDDDHVLGLFRQGLDHVAHGRAGHAAADRAHG